MMFSYSSTLYTAIDVTQYSALLLPLFLAIDVNSAEYWTLDVLYVEAVTLSFSVKNILKLAFPRYRPYMYYSGPPESLISQKDFKNSFPSGHSTMAFTGATFFSYLYNYYHPESPWRLPLTIGAYSVAVATAALQVTSGSHFVSDVLAGAPIGSLSGFLVPYLHTKSREGKSDSQPRILIVPGYESIGLMVRY
jgi:undecaprenyl-diphosphatase